MALSNEHMPHDPTAVSGAGLEYVEQSGQRLAVGEQGWEQLGYSEKTVNSAIEAVDHLESEGLDPEEVDAEVAKLVPDAPEAGIIEAAKPGLQDETASALNSLPVERLEETFNMMGQGGVPEEALEEAARDIDTVRQREIDAADWLKQHLQEVKETIGFTFTLDEEPAESVMTTVLDIGEEDVPASLQGEIARQLMSSHRANLLLDNNAAFGEVDFDAEMAQDLLDSDQLEVFERNMAKFRDLPVELADGAPLESVLKAYQSFDGITPEYLQARMAKSQAEGEASGVTRWQSYDFRSLPPDAQHQMALAQLEGDGKLDLASFSELPDTIAEDMINSADIDNVRYYQESFAMSDSLKDRLSMLPDHGTIPNRDYLEVFPDAEHTRLALRQIDSIRVGGDVPAALEGLDDLDSQVMLAYIDKLGGLDDTQEYSSSHVDRSLLYSQLDRFSRLDDEVAQAMLADMPRDLQDKIYSDQLRSMLQSAADNPEVFVGEMGRNLVNNAEYIGGIDNILLSDEVVRELSESDLDVDALLSDTATLKDAMYHHWAENFNGLHTIETGGRDLGFDDGQVDTATRLRAIVKDVGGSVDPNTILRYVNVRQESEAVLGQAAQVTQLVEKIAHSSSSEVASFADTIVPMVLETDDPQAKFDEIEQVFTSGDLPTALIRLEVFTTMRGDMSAEQIARYSPVFAAELERGGDPIDVVRDDLLRASAGSNSRSLRKFLEGAIASQSGGELASVGIDDPQAMLDQMDKTAELADQRGRELAARGEFNLKQGDLLKGVLKHDQLAWLPGIMQSGSLAKEFLGAASSTDNTPLDTDLGQIQRDRDSLRESVDTSMAREYGDLYFVLSDRPDRWSSGPDEPDKLELLGDGEKQGVRTGFGSSEIDFMIVNGQFGAKERQQLAWEIVKNGFYVPVVDKDSGELAFSPEQFDQMRSQLAGASEYGADSYEFGADIGEAVSGEAIDSVRQNLEIVADRRQRVITQVEQAMQISTDATVVDTGSTGRGTNIPGSGDYDLMMLVDPSVLRNSDKMGELRQSITGKFGGTAEVVVTDRGDLRITGATIEGVDGDIEVDVSFAARTNQVEYTLEQSLIDRYDSIKAQDEEKYYQVLANVVQAKRLLKDAEAYKSRQSTGGEGGLGGIGVEHWILQHGGSLAEAAKSFTEASAGKSYQEFTASYTVFGAGQNHFKLVNGEYPYSNFIVDNMDASGYSKMQQVCRSIVESQQ